ncbi:hypothetical protein ANRL3_02584 [Anaerolineae bacterium]|nr:hypothetical protein ANRL3_02584 [Anaerolineae bacterium]
MIEPVLPATSAASLIKYLIQWLRSLSKASDKRKIDCMQAVEAVIIGVRKTERYCRERDQGKVNPDTEAQLAVMWTELGFQLEALGVKKLAKRCDVKGQYWASPQKFSEEWWDKADIGLASVERLARGIRAEIQVNGAPRN